PQPGMAPTVRPRRPLAPGSRAPSRPVVSRPLPRIPGFRHQPRILHGHADREVIQTLKRVTREPEDLVDWIVVITADAGAPCAGGLGGEIQALAHHARLPEQLTVERRAELLQAGIEFREHPEAEETVGGN